MPILANEEVSKIAGSTFQFSAVRPEELEETEYTLITVVVDNTGSVGAFSDDLLAMLKETIAACKKSPKRESIMLRVLTFNANIDEVHGFRNLMDIEVNDYNDFRCGGMTALYDAVFSAVGATNTFAKTLVDKDFTVNGGIYIITDGADNASTMSANAVAEEFKKALSGEKLESLVSVLIGINDIDCANELSDFKDDAGISQYVAMGDVTAGKLAKLGGFISKSISSQSQSLGTGSSSAPPSSLTF